MGWDAHSTTKKDWEKKKLKNPATDKLFKNAYAYAVQKAGSADGCLSMGWIHSSSCAEMLYRATDRNVWGENPWNKSFVKKLAEKADWDFDYDKDQAWAYWSAKIFLETCAKANLSISFSW